jgi:hypothetical protein
VTITRFRVREAFSATLVATRRCERFVRGELVVRVEGPNGRPNRDSFGSTAFGVAEALSAGTPWDRTS